MADADTQVNLTRLHDAIAQEVKAFFGAAVKTVECYREETDRSKLGADELPAILFEMDEADGDDEEDPGTEQQAVSARFVAYVILSFRTTKAKLEVRKMALALGALTRCRRWKWTDPDVMDATPVTIRTGPGKLIGCYPDDFAPVATDDREVWRVEWRHVIHFGTSVWNPDEGAAPPEKVFVGMVPEVGFGNEDQYAEVTDIPGPPPP